VSQHYLRQIEKLKHMMLTLGDLAGRSVEEAIDAIHRRDDQRAADVIAREPQIDVLEVDLEEECLHTLALYQPVASDLRFIVALVTINKDLERIGDLAVDLAEQALYLGRTLDGQPIPFDLVGESRRVREMLRLALEALVNTDADLAERVRQSDDAVDRIHAHACNQIEAAIRQNPSDTGRLLRLLNVTRQLERIADHTVNIAEDVIYMARGEFLRHRAARPAVVELAALN
jgi:phosphate transport system protein